MKKVLNNKKGFTLIELLAVIVILAILVMAIMPAVTRFLTESRKGTFSNNALTAIDAVRTEVVLSGNQSNAYYTIAEINKLLEKKLNKSPFDNTYDTNSHVKVEYNDKGATYSICLSDGSYGITEKETDVDKSKVVSSVKACELPDSDTFKAITVDPE